MRPVSTALLLLLAGAAMGQGEVVIYRCTDTFGTVTLQNGTPCPKGSKQERRSVEAVPNFGPPPAAPIVSAPQPQAPRAPTPDAKATAAAAPAFAPVLPLPDAEKPLPERLPPPPLYQCNTPDNDSYLSDTSEPKPRCVRVDTVGIDGSQSLGAGRACRMVFDQCQRIADNAACPAWRRRVNEAQAAWTFARADMSADLKRDYERIARVVAETTCNTAP
jgi:hypothetical protein